jgi:hypothetical protein
MSADIRKLGCGRDVGRFPVIARTLKQMLERFLNALTCVDRCFVGPDTLEQLSGPSKRGNTRTAGIDLNRPRMRHVARAIIALSVRAGGFSASDLAEHVRGQSAFGTVKYGSRQAAYDLQKFQGKGLVCRIGKSRRYRSEAENLKAISALLLIRDHVLVPLLAASINNRSKGSTQGDVIPIEQLYLSLRSTMGQVLEHLGLAA